MSKRKPSKSSHSPKIAAKAQRAAQAVARSPSNNRPRSPRAGSTDSPPQHNAPEQEALLVTNPVTASQAELRPEHHEPEQQARPVEHPVSALQAELPPERHDPQQDALPIETPAAELAGDSKQTMTDSGSKAAPDFPSAATNPTAYANGWAYQAKLQEMAQANMQFAFEFPQRLAAIRSPGEFFSVFAEFTQKRIAMFQQYSKK